MCLRVKKGSTMLMIIVFIAILSILGIAIGSLAVSGYKLRSLNEISKNNVYLAESGLDKAYVIIGKLLDEAVNEGNTAVATAMSTLDLTTPASEGNTFLNSDGTVNEENIKMYQDNIFKTTYKNTIESNIVNRITQGDYLFLGESIKPEISIISNAEELKFNNEKLIMKLQSKFNYKSIEKNVGIDYEIAVPDYGSFYYIKSSVVNTTVQANVLQNIIAVEGNVIIQSDNVKINGDVFIKDKGADGVIIDPDSNVDINSINVVTSNSVVANFPNLQYYNSYDIAKENGTVSKIGELVLLNPDIHKNYAFVGPKGNIDDFNGMDVEIIDLRTLKGSGEVKVAIITAGTVFMTGNIKFMGSVICGGNLVLMDGSSIDTDIDIKEQEAQAEKLLQPLEVAGVFNSEAVLETSVITDIDYEMGVDNTSGSNSITNTLIKKKNWRIEK